MTFFFKVLSAVVLILIPSATWARLGETLDQCISRYGQPVDHNSEEAFEAISGTRTAGSLNFAHIANTLISLRKEPRAVAIAEAAGATHPSHAVGEVYLFQKDMPAESPSPSGGDTTAKVDIWATVVDGTVQRMKYTISILTGFSPAVRESLLSLNGWVGLAEHEELNPDLRAAAEKYEITVERRQLKEKEDAEEDSASKSKAKKATEGF